MSGTPSPRAVLVFDGDCGFCTWSAERLRRWSTDELAIVPWQRADLAGMGLTAEECAEAVRCIAPDGRFGGGQAVARALQCCRQPWRAMGGLLSARVMAPLVVRGYAAVAANRHRLPGATPACALDGDEGRGGRSHGEGAGGAVPPAPR